MNLYRARIVLKDCARDYDVRAENIGSALRKLSRHIGVRETSLGVSVRVLQKGLKPSAFLKRDVAAIDEDLPARDMAAGPPRNASRSVFDYARGNYLGQKPIVLQIVTGQHGIVFADSFAKRLSDYVGELQTTYDWPRFLYLVREVEEMACAHGGCLGQEVATIDHNGS